MEKRRFVEKQDKRKPMHIVRLKKRKTDEDANRMRTRRRKKTPDFDII